MSGSVSAPVTDVVPPDFLFKGANRLSRNFGASGAFEVSACASISLMVAGCFCERFERITT